MPCYHPLPAYRSYVRGKTGKCGIVFNPLHRSVAGSAELMIPCGRCIGCRLERARQWALRCTHEAKLWERNCFVTLTYSDEFLPLNGSLVPEHYVLFMKRLRKLYGNGIRFFHCGEYGEQLGRPHHHAILFNHDFDDKRWYKSSASGEKLYTSATLERLWRFGMCAVGSATFESAGYVARYSLKKVTGPLAKEYYNGKVPEYLTMSRRPGIGKVFFDKFQGDVYPTDECIVRGFPSRPPRYYDKLLERESPEVFARIKAKRVEDAANDPDSTGSRLIVREVVKMSQVRSLSGCEDIKPVRPGGLPVFKGERDDFYDVFD